MKVDRWYIKYCALILTIGCTTRKDGDIEYVWRWAMRHWPLSIKRVVDAHHCALRGGVLFEYLVRGADDKELK
jgi:hypothetical protein